MALKSKESIISIKIGWIGILCIFLWAGCEEPAGPNSASPETPSKLERSTDRMIAHLYFSDSDHTVLQSEQRSLPVQIRPETLGTLIVQALLEGPKQTLDRTIPAGTRLRGFYILENHTAYIDLSREIRDRHPGGAHAELLTIYAIVNSLIMNIPEVETVKILVEGKEVTTLAGHVDLRSPLRANLLYVR